MLRISSIWQVGLCLSFLTCISLAFQQALLNDAPANRLKRVAVIGAGPAGTSFAYHLHNYSSQSDISLAITVYDRESYIGGRSTTVNVYDEPLNPVELGASIFVQVNHILHHAVSYFNLSTRGIKPDAKTSVDNPDTLLGIWDGESLLLKEPTDTTSNPLENYWRKARLLWRYGIAPLRTQSLVKDVVGKFLNLYEAPHFPFSSLTYAVNALNLTPVTSIDGWHFLQQNHLAGDFAWEVIQAANRVNYASNLLEIHGVEAMVSMATDGAVSVNGGNFQIFAGMANASQAELRLGTEVRRVQRNEKGQGFVVVGDEANGEGEGSNVYDAVVIAAPFHQTSIEFEAGILHHTPADDPYRELFVTLFTTSLSLSRSYFNLGLLDDVPTTILTTEPRCRRPGASKCAKDRLFPSFFSISTLRAVVNPTTGRRERLYKIFSPKKISEAFLAELFGLEQPSDGRSTKDDITWIHRKRWLSYPIEFPRETFEPLRLDAGQGDGIWYTAGMEGFISTMETNALMGGNVARLLVDNWMGLSSSAHAEGVVRETLHAVDDEL